jgi:hypothetical protein
MLCRKVAQGGLGRLLEALELAWGMLYLFYTMFKYLLGPLIFATTVHADLSQPGVWDSLQEGATDQQLVPAQITDINLIGDGVWVTYKREGQNTKTKLCDDFALGQHNNDNFRSEEHRAAMLRERMTDLREAKKTKETVNLIYKGPWSPCLLGIAQAE